MTPRVVALSKSVRVLPAPTRLIPAVGKSKTSIGMQSRTGFNSAFLQLAVEGVALLHLLHDFRLQKDSMAPSPILNFAPPGLAVL